MALYGTSNKGKIYAIYVYIFSSRMLFYSLFDAPSSSNQNSSRGYAEDATIFRFDLFTYFQMGCYFIVSDYSGDLVASYSE